MTAGVADIARSSGLLHGNQGGSLSGRSTYPICLSLTQAIRTLPGAWLTLTTPYLHIKNGFHNVNVFTM